MYASSNPMGETETETCGDDDLLPEDVLIEILVWLPVISLLRFKSVCKSWRALIQSPLFIDLHAATTTRFEAFILQVFANPIDTWESDDPDDDDDTWDDSDVDGTLEYVDSAWGESASKMIIVSSQPEPGSRSGSGGGGGGEGEVFGLYDLGFLSCYTDLVLTKSLRMVGSCNGLICLHNSELRDVFLWNPATRQFRILPKSITIEEEGIGESVRDFVAFGFDVKTKDYKVVHISFFYRLNETVWICRVQVYTLSTDSWRLLEGINSLAIEPIRSVPWYNHGIYLNGSYFFVGRIFKDYCVCPLDGSILPTCNDSVMMSFDFTTEIFTTMQFPDHDTRHRLVLSYLGDKIVLFTARPSREPYPGRDPDDKEYFDIWVLNEQGGSNSLNKDSWAKLHSFQIRYMPLTQPKCILKDGKFALISSKTDDKMCCKLQFFNLVTKEVQLDTFVGEDVLSADVYKQTLVSVVGGNGAAAAADR